MTVQELRNSINKNKIENIYLFSGSEIGEKNEILKIIEKNIFGNVSPMKYTFYCDNEFNIEEFIDTLNSNLLFSDSKIILLKRVESISKELLSQIENIIIPQRIRVTDFENKILNKITSDEQKRTLLSFYTKDENGFYLLKKLKDADIKKIVTIFETIDYCAIDKNTYLIMLNETNDKIPNGLTNLLNQKQNIVFWEMFENQKQNWIRAEFKKYELFIEDKAVDFIINTIENNKQQFENEIQKIVSSFPNIKNNNKNVVTKDVLEDFLYHSKEETSFTLYTALLEKKLENALAILDKIFYSDEKSILNGLLWSHRRFLKIIDLYENEGKSPEEIFSMMYINIKKAKEEYITGLKNYRFTEIVNLFYYLMELDYYMKVLPNELKLIKLQEFIITFIGNTAKQTFLSGNLITFME